MVCISDTGESCAAYAQRFAAERGWKPCVLTFDPHPTRVVAPERTPPLLTSPEVRARLMAEEGIEAVLILPFSQEVAHLTPEEFGQRLLVDAMQARAVLVGDNFRFGHKAAGNVRVLAEIGARLGFATEIVPAISCRGRVVSSSGIRDLIRAGNVSLAARFLLHAYGIEGEVVAGRGVGSKQTVPTLNLATSAEVIPAAGVYVTRTRDSWIADGSGTRSLTSGIVPPSARSEEGASGDRSCCDLRRIWRDGATRIQVDFLRRVRAERKFESPESLREQILKDVHAAQSLVPPRRQGTERGRDPACISC